MTRTLSILPLHLTAYSDRMSILAAYSREMGRVSLSVPAGGGREARRLRALLMPLTPVECNVDIRPGREIHRMSAPRALQVLHTVLTDPLRSAMAMFLAEVLNATLRQSEGEPTLFDFITDAVRRLNSPTTSVANFHLAFLWQLARHLGIEPDLSGWAPGRVLDLQDGVCRATPPLHGRFLSPDETLAAARLSAITWENQHLYRFTRQQRAQVLDLMLDYISLHYANLRSLRSLSILQQLFN
jgi:DNA repair protein RecO (recombination protein O)